MPRLLPKLALLPLLAACTTSRAFAPREHAGAVGPTGRPAVVHELRGDGWEAEVQLWCDGARREVVDGEETTVLRTGFLVANRGPAPLAIDPGGVLVERAYAVQPAPVPLAPIRVGGDVTAAPGAVARIEFVFTPGPAIGPRDLEAFDLRWRVRSGDATVFEQVTPFAMYVPEVDWFYDDDAYSDFVSCPRGSGRW